MLAYQRNVALRLSYERYTFPINHPTINNNNNNNDNNDNDNNNNTNNNDNNNNIDNNNNNNNDNNNDSDKLLPILQRLGIINLCIP